MADHQRKIPKALKQKLIEEADGTCANPGCTNPRTHIHHIKHWAIYKSHVAEDMVAICPSCHDAAHHGRLRISDDDLYRWKGISRSNSSNSTLVYVEPANELKLLTGTIAISASNGPTVFAFSNDNRLQIRVLDGDLLQVSSRLTNQRGQEVFRVVENHVRVVRDSSIGFDFRAGKAAVTVPATDDYLPQWAIDQMRVDSPTFGADGRLIALELEVLKPGLLRVQGFWPAAGGVVVITHEALSFCRQGLQRPLSLVGEGEGSLLVYAGPITAAMFGFGP